MRTITVNYNYKNIQLAYDPEAGETLSNILIKNNIYINTACGGNGTCGKCAVEISDGTDTFTELACKYYPTSNITITPENPEADENRKVEENPKPYAEPAGSNGSAGAVADSVGVSAGACAGSTDSCSGSAGAVSISADIGSTSISICINKDDATADSYTFAYPTITFPNPTIPYGADVISRIHASMSGKSEDLRSLLCTGINDAVMLLLKKNRISPASLSRVVISCNNTMQHILLGLDCAPLSAYPFSSQNKIFDVMHYNSVFNSGHAFGPRDSRDSFMDGCAADVYIIPSFSAFIGGDIVSGLYSLNLHRSKKAFLFLDLGTNAEMVIGNGSRMLCTSAAAGPAFEASSLSCGCACAPGAIYDITLSKTGHAKSGHGPYGISHGSCGVSHGPCGIRYKTIQNKLPVGICGSGILKLISQMLDTGLIDSYGTLAPEYADEGFAIAKAPRKNIILTQKDIRELQLAISAIRTGIDILLDSAGMSASDIETVYVSGSFGSALDFHDIKNLNILKHEWLQSPHTVISAGNTSLNGAVKYAHDTQADSVIDSIISGLDEIVLAGHDAFNTLFMDNINFTI